MLSSSPTLRSLLLAVVVAGCASAPPPVPVAPAPPPAAAAPPEPSPAASAKPPAVVPAAVPPPPAACAELLAHATSGCAPAGEIRAALAAAVAEDDASRRDAALACLEPSEAVAPGSVRALRAELAPEGCADALVAPVLETAPKGMTTEIEQTLLGLMVSARLGRLLGDPPVLEPPLDKPRFLAFFHDRLTPWVLAEAAAIEKLSREGAELAGYGRGVAAIAAGSADLRFVEMVRAVPLPDEMKADRDVSDAYYGQLDQALEPRKVRGRDAALVGLRIFAELGAVGDARVTRARSLLNALWAGSHIDALDHLLLPELEPPELSTPALVLAARLPTFYAKAWLADLDPTEPKLLRAFLERGVPAPLRAKLDAAKLSDPARLLYARALIASGRRFFRASDFAHARAVLEPAPPGELGRLLAALGHALESGPADATELMLKGPLLHGSLDVTALDAEVARRGKLAGYAAFDAAELLSLVPPENDAAFWDDLAQRFAQAEKLFARAPAANVAAAEKSARESAQAARATAAALRAQH